MPRDIVERLRDRAYSGLPDPLLEEAADEIERLRNGALADCETVQSDHIPDAGKMAKTSTNHDAAPAARACVGRPRTDKADLPTRAGTGNTPVTEPMPALSSGSGSVTPVSYLRTDENRVFYDTKSLRNGALSGCETVPDPDSRVWETPSTPQPHAIPAKGSAQGDGSVRDSRNANEPVAWAVMVDGRRMYVSWCKEMCEDEAYYHRHPCGDSVSVVPLYRQPHPTLTDAERASVETAVLALVDLHVGQVDVVATLRGLLERLGN